MLRSGHHQGRQAQMFNPSPTYRAFNFMQQINKNLGKSNNSVYNNFKISIYHLFIKYINEFKT